MPEPSAPVPCECTTPQCEVILGFTTWYDDASNRLFDRHLHADCRSHLYTDIDAANRLLAFQRGKLVEPEDGALLPTAIEQDKDLTLPGADRDRTYDLDLMGNWKSTTFTPIDEEGQVQETQTQDRGKHGPLNQIPGLNHDPNGNLLDDGTRTYKYDVLNRLRQVYRKEDGELLVDYEYDAFNRRVRKVVHDLDGNGYGGLDAKPQTEEEKKEADNFNDRVPAATTDYLYWGDQCVEERAPNSDEDTVLRQYVWGQYIDELVQQREYNPSDPESYEDLYPLHDLRNTTVALTHSSQRILETYDTDAYGNTIIHKSCGNDGAWFTDDDETGQNPLCPFIYTGRRYDPETKLYYYRARHYNPQLGRFIQRDPIGYAGGLNLYEYAGSNPTINVDPYGEELVTILLIGAVVLGAASGWAGTIHSAARENRQASIGEQAFGTAIGGVFGFFVPWAAYGSAVGGNAGYWGGRMTGQWDPHTGYLVGEMAGGIVGGGVHAARQVAQQAGTNQLRRAGLRGFGKAIGLDTIGSVGGASIGYATGGDPLLYANWGMMGTSAANGIRKYTQFLEKAKKAKYLALRNNEPRIRYDSSLQRGIAGKADPYTGNIAIQPNRPLQSLARTVNHEMIHSRHVPSNIHLAAYRASLTMPRGIFRAAEELQASLLSGDSYRESFRYARKWL